MEVLEFMLDTWWYFGLSIAIGVGLAFRHNQGYITLKNLLMFILLGILSYFGFLLLIIFWILILFADFVTKKPF